MASDNVIRQAVYSQTMLETNDARLATMRAAEIINFRRTGSSRIVNVMRQVSPFINANLQALNVVGGTLLLDGISPKTKMEALTFYIKHYDANHTINVNLFCINE
jgi:hypothetical protein